MANYLVSEIVVNTLCLNFSPINKSYGQFININQVSTLQTQIHRTKMSNQNTSENSESINPKKEALPKQAASEYKNRDNELASKMKKKRKSTVSKVSAFNKEENEVSIGKQTKLTELWKLQNNTSQSVSKNNAESNEAIKKRFQQEIENRNKKINQYKKERDQWQRRYNGLENQKKNYQSKAKQNLKTALLDLAKNKRLQKYEIIPKYGYFRESVFMEGPFLKDIRSAVQNKIKEMGQLRQQQVLSKKDKQMFQFRQRFMQKQLDQLNEQLKDRQSIVLAYKQRLKFGEKQNNCYYSRLGWPAIGQDERFQVLELLGSGGFGEVYKCYDLHNNTYVALKQNRFTHSGPRYQDYKQEFLKHVNRQVRIQNNLRHPNIAKLIEIIKIDESEVSFILQHCQGPELSKYLKKYQCLQQKQAKQIIRQIFSALKYLYQQDNKIIHYDLKPSNIMFHHGVIKILDFGLCKQIDSDETRIGLTSQGTGTYWYLPPETFFDCGAEVSSKVDVWSAGVIFFELLYGKRPFGHGVSQTKIINEGIILKEALKLQFPSQTPLKYKVSDSAKTFITQCLKYKQEDRLSPIEAYEHAYFK